MFKKRDNDWIDYDRSGLERNRTILRTLLASDEAKEALGYSGSQSIRVSDRPNTERAYLNDQRRYILAADSAGIDPLAPTSAFWTKYFNDLSSEKIQIRTKRSASRQAVKPEFKTRQASTLYRAACGIANLFYQHGLTAPTRTFMHKRLMRTLSRRNARPPQKAKALWGEHAKRLVVSYGRRTLRSLRDCVIAAFGVNRGFRGATIVGLKIEHVSFERRGVVIGIEDDKTIVTGTMRYTPTPHNAKHVACLPCILKEYVTQLKEIGIQEGPLLRPIDQWGNLGDSGLTSKSVTALLRKGLDQAGIEDASAYSSHSYRHGVVHSAISNHWPIEDIMLVTLHRSRRGIRPYIDAIDPWYFAPRSIPLVDGRKGNGWLHAPI